MRGDLKRQCLGVHYQAMGLCKHSVCLHVCLYICGGEHFGTSLGTSQLETLAHTHSHTHQSKQVLAMYFSPCHFQVIVS